MSEIQQSEVDKIGKSKKMMLWFGIVSLSMMFGGLTSAYIVSKERKDWITDFNLPQAFYISTAVILLSSLTIYLAKRNIKSGNAKMGRLFLVGTLALGIVFVILQFLGFEQIIESGYYFTGSESTITTSFIYTFVITHIAHIAAGLLVLIYVIFRSFRGKYSSGNMLGIELAATFWHFVDFLWVYLFLFLLFFR